MNEEKRLIIEEFEEISESVRLLEELADELDVDISHDVLYLTAKTKKRCLNIR